MFLQSWGDIFSQSLQDLWLGVAGFLPDLLLALIFFIAGWVVGTGLGQLITRGLEKLKFDRALKQLELDVLLARAGYRLRAAMFVGELVRWFIIVVFFMSSLEIVGLSQVNTFFQEAVVEYLPHVIIAVLVLVLASVLATIMRTIVRASVRAAGLRTARLLGTITYYAIWIFAFAVVLSELGLSAKLIEILFMGVIAMLAIAGGLAFGLGGRDAAARTIESLKKEFSSDDR